MDIENPVQEANNMMDHFGINDLPNEILMKIFQYLNYDDLRDASLVCHQWYDITHTNSFLPSLSTVKVPILDKDEDIKFLKENFHNFKFWRFNDYKLLLNENFQLHDKKLIKSVTIDIDSVDNLIEILQKYKNLEELNLSINEMTMTTKNINIEDTKNMHNNLKSLTIHHFGAICSRGISFALYLILLKILDIFSNLECLKIDLSPLGKEHIDFIITKFGSTLKELHLHPFTLRHNVIFNNLNLKKLKFNFIVIESSNFEEFIETQKNLVSLDLYSAEILNDELIMKIINNSQNLKELILNCEDDSMLKLLNLKSLKNLNKFCVKWRSNNQIPSNFFKEKYPNLIALDLAGCFKVVNDSLLQSIIKNLPNLSHLNLSSCTQISDKGITGINFNEDGGAEGVSIANLKGLRSLDLSTCYKITDFSVEFGLKFLELREINLQYCKYISKKGLEQLAQNCPSLVLLKINRKFYVDKELLSKFKRFNLNRTCKSPFEYFS